jgi:hypothetical protein
MKFGAWDVRSHYRSGSLKTDHLEGQGVDGSNGSEWILGRLSGGCGLDSTVSGQGPVAGCCECVDEPSDSCATELVSLLCHSRQKLRHSS